MKTVSPIAWLLLAGLLYGLPAEAAQISTERFRSAVDIDPNGSLLIDNPIGAIVVMGTSRPGLRWEAVKIVRGEEAADVAEGRENTRLKIEGAGNEVALRTLVPYPLRNGRWSSSVAYKIEVPASIRLTIHSISGELIHVAGVQGAVSIKNVNGKIVLDRLPGPLRVESVNALIRARLPDQVTSGANLSTVNGTIELIVPPQAEFNWTAETVRGGIHSTFAVPGFTRRVGGGSQYFAAIRGNAGPVVTTTSLLGDVFLIGADSSVARAQAILTAEGGDRVAPVPAQPLRPENRTVYQRVSRTILLKEPSTRSFAAQESSVTGDFRIEVPIGSIFAGEVKGSANVTTKAGEIVMGRVDGSAHLRSMGGSLHLGDVLGSLDAQTLVGDITVRTARRGGRAATDGGYIQVGLNGGPLSLHSGGGDIQVQRTSGPIEATAHSGDIMLTVDPQQKSLAIEAVSEDGSVILNVPPGFGAEIDAIVIAQNDRAELLSSDIPGLTIVRESIGGRVRVRATGRINGGGQKVTLRSNEGSIQIRTTPVSGRR